MYFEWAYVGLGRKPWFFTHLRPFATNAGETDRLALSQMSASLLGVLLVVVSSLAYSTLDLTRKILVTRMSGAALLFFLSLGQLPFFACWIAANGSGSIERGYVLPAAISVVLNIAANLLFMEAVRLSPLSLTIPFLALTPVFTTLLGIPLLGEMPGPLQLVGVAVVVLGAFQLNRRPASGGPGVSAWRALVRERGSLLMVLVAICWSLAMPLDKLALASADAAIHGLVLNGGVAGGLIVFMALSRRMTELKAVGRVPMLLTVAVLVSVLGLGTLFLSLGYLWVSVAETLRRAIGSVAALLLGRSFFGEPLTAAKVVGIALMSVGVALILL